MQLERVSSGRLRYSARTADDVIARVYGAAAVVIERRKQTATFEGKPRPSEVRATEVWLKREASWRLISTQTTPVLAPAPTLAPLLPGQATAQTTGTTNSANERTPSAKTIAEIANSPSQAEREVLKARQELDDATTRNDVDALARIYGDDYLFVTYAGTLTNKQYQLEAFRSGFMRIPARTPEEVMVRVYGDTALTITRRKQTATVAGQTRSPEQRVTGVWVKLKVNGKRFLRRSRESWSPKLNDAGARRGF